MTAGIVPAQTNPRHGRVLVAALITTISFGGLPALSAAAAGFAEPPAAGNIAVYSSDDMIIAKSYAAPTITVQVVRGGNVIGTATDVPANGSTVNINKSGGTCFDNGSTPDIRDGDLVQVVTQLDTGDQTTVADVVVTQPAAQTAPGTVVVKGTAKDAGSQPLALTTFDVRVIAAGTDMFSDGSTKRIATSRGADGTLAYDAPGSSAWTATFSGLSGADAAVATAARSLVVWFGPQGKTGSQTTTSEYGVSGGPANGCAPTTGPAPSTPDLRGTSDLGASNADDITADVTPTFNGKPGDPSATEERLYVDGTLAATGAPQQTATGWKYVLTPASPLTDATYQVGVGEVVGSTETMSPGTLSVTIDTSKPTVAITNPPPAQGAPSSGSIGFTVNEPATTECSLRPAAQPDSFATCSSPKSYGPLSAGSYRFSVRPTDTAGNVGTVQSATFAVQAGTGGPAAPGTPTADPPSGYNLGTTGQVPVRISWAASATPSVSYIVEKAVNGGSFTAVTTTTALSTVQMLPKGSSYAYRVRAKNGSGVQSVNAVGTPFTPSVLSETAARYVGPWTLKKVTGSAGGNVQTATAANANSTLTFTGTGVGWVSAKGPGRGIVRLYLDGATTPTATIDLYNSAYTVRRQVYGVGGLSAGSHTLKILVTGTKNAAASGTRVDVDAFTVLQ